jgi:hypothetical protein
MDDQTPTPIAADAPAAPVSETSQTSETARAPVTPSDRLARMSPAESAAWRKDGTVPGVEAPVSAQADGDGGDDVDEDHGAAAAETPAPVPVSPAASAAGKALNRQKQTAQQRINDLARDKYRLEGELKALRAQHDPSRPAAAAEVPAPAPAPAPSSDAGLVEPKEEDFDTYAQFVRATARYETRLAHAADRADRAAEQGRAQLSEVQKAHDARLDVFIATHPDYRDVIQNQTEVYPTPLLADAVLHSDLAPEIAYHLNTHLDEYRALIARAPGPMIKALGKLEARLEATTPTAAPAASTPQHITRAPAPPVTLGSRPADPADDVERAGARRDVGAYIRAQNARELAARR